jgi:O-Antigen ligase
MSARQRLLLLAVLGSALGIFVGVKVANEEYGWISLAALFCCWVIVERTSDAPPDAWLLAVVLVGMIVGNRGFAQIQPAAQIPLLPAEAVLLAAAPALVVRIAVKREAGVRKDFLNYSILVWMVIGAARLPLDVNRYGIVALRDFATIYYAAFFFIAQAFGSHAASDRLLQRALTGAFVLLLPVVVSIQLAPDYLIDHFTWRGVPIIYHKSDLISTSLAAGFFWLWTRMEKSRRRAWLLPAATSLLLVGVIPSPRAAMAAAAVTTLLWLAVRRWRILAAQVAIVSTASAVALAAVWFSGRDVRTSAPYSAYEHAISIFDPEGTGSYINAESGDPGGNNRFRLIWWRDVIDETLATSPVFGLGFGADLASRFLADYDLLSDENFSARSPHSMVMTVLGRMGIAGLLAWIAVSAGLGRMAWRLFRGGTPDGVGLASIVCVTWISACFGVVLEGPMGAVVFWTVAGLANARAWSAVRSEGAVQADRPVAKAGAFDHQPALP